MTDNEVTVNDADSRVATEPAPTPTAAQRRWLLRGIDQPGGKLPMFDTDGGTISPRTVKSCLAHGWAERWFDNPVKPGWLVCKLTDKGRAAVSNTEQRKRPT